MWTVVRVRIVAPDISTSPRDQVSRATGFTEQHRPLAEILLIKEAGLDMGDAEIPAMSP
jgi:hypothetical protein